MAIGGKTYDLYQRKLRAWQRPTRRFSLLSESLRQSHPGELIDIPYVLLFSLIFKNHRRACQTVPIRRRVTPMLEQSLAASNALDMSIYNTPCPCCHLFDEFEVIDGGSLLNRALGFPAMCDLAS